MALSAAGSSGSRRQNSAYSPTGIGDTFFSYEFSVLGFFNWDMDFTDLQRSIFNPENLRSSASCLSYLFVLFVFFLVPSFRFSVLGFFSWDTDFAGYRGCSGSILSV